MAVAVTVQSNNGAAVSGVNTKTFTSQSVGTAAADRGIGIGALISDNGQTETVSSVTIGGNAATRVDTTGGFTAVESGTTHHTEVSLWWALLAAGTTANIVLNFSGTTSIGGVCIIQVFRFVGADTSVPFLLSANAHAASNSVSAAMNLPTNGAVIGVAGFNDSGPPGVSDWTWTNLTGGAQKNTSGTGSFCELSPGTTTSTGTATRTASYASGITSPQGTGIVVASLQVPLPIVLKGGGDDETLDVIRSRRSTRSIPLMVPHREIIRPHVIGWRSACERAAMRVR